MGYELLNFGQVTPPRLLALLRLVASRDTLPRARLLDLIQPRKLVENQNAAENVLQAAKQCGLVTESADQVQLAIPPEQITTPVAFRACLQRRILGVADEDRPNYLFNLFTAWYYVQGDRVLTQTRQTLTAQFNQEWSGEDERAFNPTKVSGWLQWAIYLQMGWQMRLSTGASSGSRTDPLIPDPSARVQQALPEAFDGRARQPVHFAVFANRLASLCPELDGGALYEQCWGKTYPGTPHGNSMSFALSTALRVLHQAGEIELIYHADAPDTWRLVPAQGFEPRAVTHISRRQTA